MPNLSDRERETLDQIGRMLETDDARLVERFVAPRWFYRWRCGVHREHLTALVVVLSLSVIPATIALFQWLGPHSR